jgi:hypothetical protein
MRAGALPSDAEVRRLTAEILARPEYGHRRTDEAAWLDFFERLRAWIDGAFGWLNELAVAAPVLYWTLFAGLLLLALAMLGHVVVAVRAALRAPVPPRPARPGAAARDFAAEAEALAAEGRFLDAARRLQLACLELLISRGEVRLSRSETNRSLRRELARAPLPEEQRRAFAELLVRLERQVFRDRDEDRTLYDGWRGLHGALRGPGAA